MSDLESSLLPQRGVGSACSLAEMASVHWGALSPTAPTLILRFRGCKVQDQGSPPAGGIPRLSLLRGGTGELLGSKKSTSLLGPEQQHSGWGACLAHSQPRVQSKHPHIVPGAFQKRSLTTEPGYGHQCCQLWSQTPK